MTAKISEILYSELSEFEKKLYSKQIKSLNIHIKNWGLLEQSRDSENEVSLGVQLHRSLSYQINILGQNVKNISAAAEKFGELFKKAGSEKERHEHILDLCHILGSRDTSLKLDEKACFRWLDEKAVVERYQNRLGRYERDIIFLFRCLTQIFKYCLAQIEQLDISERKTDLWQELDIEQILSPWVGYRNNERVQSFALDTLRNMLSLCQKKVSPRLSVSLSNYVLRCCLDTGLSMWVQLSAIDLMIVSQPIKVKEIVNIRLRQAQDTGSIIRAELFTRWMILETNSQVKFNFVKEKILMERPYVQQAIINNCEQFEITDRIELLQLLQQEITEKSVILIVIESIVKTMEKFPLEARLWILLRRFLRNENNATVKRAVLWHIQTIVRILIESESEIDKRQKRLSILGNFLQSMINNSISPDVEFWLIQAREIFIVKTAHFGNSETQNYSINSQILEARSDFGFAIDNNNNVKSGWQKSTSIWRLLDQFLTTRTDKREFFNHALAKKYHGQTWIPNPTFGELSSTDVPGEDIIDPASTETSHYLPPIDFLVSLLLRDSDSKVGKIVTLDGTIYINLPSNVLQRIRAYLNLNLNIRNLHQLRNGDHQQQVRYLNLLEKLGFGFTLHQPTSRFINDAKPRKKVRGFYLHGVTPLFVAGWWLDFKDYFFSVYQNSINQLIGFTAIFMTYVLGRHLITNYKASQNRKQIPLVIGGWGTRGKSGTERLKAAIFNGMGSEVFSKTTGCNAMFVHADPNGKLQEYNLYRPYDKATIWEQTHALKIAKTRGVDVFLWECMGLNPSYVTILQRWMQDDISTITNCYPDHEDTLGPSGWQVAHEMTHFIPEGGHLHTSEEQMLPILRQGASMKNCSLAVTNWYQIESIPSDILDEFSYEEHPANIALVLSLSLTMGIGKSKALSYMTQRVVPDIGVLKAFPVMQHQGSELTFINSMSANERFATLENWRRMGLNTLDRAKGDWLSVVVNNRADRVARSQAFAKVFSQEIGFDQLFVIGTNVDGFMHYLMSAWNIWLNSIQNGAKQPQLEHSELLCRKLKLSSIQSLKSESLFIAKKLGLIGKPDDWLNEQSNFGEHIKGKLKNHLVQSTNQQVAIQELNDKINSQTLSWDEFKKTGKRLMEEKVTIVEDESISGESLVKLIIGKTPPGLNCKLVGVQNIKGTGYDFMQFWRRWEDTVELIKHLSQKNTELADIAIKKLSQSKHFSFAERDLLNIHIKEIKRSKFSQRQSFQAMIEILEEKLSSKTTREKREKREKRSIAHFLKPFLTMGSSIQRKRTVDRIYSDWANFRISSINAAAQLERLQNAT